VVLAVSWYSVETEVPTFRKQLWSGLEKRKGRVWSLGETKDPVLGKGRADWEEVKGTA
jgi:hypothetical protein